MTGPTPTPPDQTPLVVGLMAALSGNRSKGFHLSAGVVLGAIVAVLVVFHLLNKSPAWDAWMAGAKAELTSRAAWVKRVGELKARAAKSDAAAAALADSADSARARFAALAAQFSDHLADEPATATSFAQVKQACFDALTLCKARGDSLAHSDSLNRTRADSSDARAARNDSLLQVGVKVHAKRCGWTVILGGGGGLVAGGTGGVTTGLAVGAFGGWGCRP